ncbi:MAG: TonB-dependent siderophore receptor, partial [Xanthobacteraceae bacterium]
MGPGVSGQQKTPSTLRSLGAPIFLGDALDGNPGRKITVGCLIAVASISAAKAQQPLPPVTVEAPVARKKPAAAKPSAEQLRV